MRSTSMLSARRYSSTGEDLTKMSKVPVIGGGLAAIVKGVKGGLGFFERASDRIEGSAKKVTSNIDGVVETINGSVTVKDELDARST